MRLKRNFLAGKDTYEWGVPYARKQVALTPAIPSVEETRSELSTIEQEADTATVTCNHFANHYKGSYPYHSPHRSGRGPEAFRNTQPSSLIDRYIESRLLGLDPKNLAIQYYILV